MPGHTHACWLHIQCLTALHLAGAALMRHQHAFTALLYVGAMYPAQYPATKVAKRSASTWWRRRAGGL